MMQRQHDTEREKDWVRERERERKKEPKMLWKFQSAAHSLCVWPSSGIIDIWVALRLNRFILLFTSIQSVSLRLTQSYTLHVSLSVLLFLSLSLSHSPSQTHKHTPLPAEVSYARRLEGSCGEAAQQVRCRVGGCIPHVPCSPLGSWSSSPTSCSALDNIWISPSLGCLPTWPLHSHSICPNWVSL